MLLIKIVKKEFGYTETFEANINNALRNLQSQGFYIVGIEAYEDMTVITYETEKCGCPEGGCND